MRWSVGLAEWTIINELSRGWSRDRKESWIAIFAQSKVVFDIVTGRDVIH